MLARAMGRGDNQAMEKSSPTALSLELINPFERREEVREIWLRLCEPVCRSYFLSWSWVGVWLDALPHDLPLKLALLKDDGEELGAFFICRAPVTRQKVIKSKGLFLNTTGRLAFDELFIEYNSIPGPDLGPEGLALLLEALPTGWDELFLQGMDAGAWPGNALEHLPDKYRLVVDREVPSPYVDLEKVRQNQGDYLGLLGSKNRAHIRRSTRWYETTYGPVSLEAAGTLDQALEFYEQLVEIHGERWRAQGQAGAFGSGFQYNFHRRLLERAFEQGEIQLLRARAGDKIFAVHYNLVYKNKVWSYNFGAAFEENKRVQPGLVSHALLMDHNSRLGYEVFDFLGGDSYYKLHLSTDANRLLWARVQKKLTKFKLEDAVSKARTGTDKSPQTESK